MTMIQATTTPADLLADLARKHLFIKTLETRNRDSLDFHEVSVWGIKAALEAAHAAGIAAKQETR